jgi:hypothetical protein
LVMVEPMSTPVKNKFDLREMCLADGLKEGFDSGP